MQPRPHCAENDHTSNSVNCIANILSSQQFLILTIVLLVSFIEEGRLNVSIYCYVVSNKIQTRCPVKRSTDSTLVLTE